MCKTKGGEELPFWQKTAGWSGLTGATGCPGGCPGETVGATPGVEPVAVPDTVSSGFFSST